MDFKEMFNDCKNLLIAKGLWDGRRATIDSRKTPCEKEKRFFESCYQQSGYVDRNHISIDNICWSYVWLRYQEPTSYKSGSTFRTIGKIKHFVEALTNHCLGKRLYIHRESVYIAAHLIDQLPIQGVTIGLKHPMKLLSKDLKSI